jgi:hypothetical protein
MDHEWRGLHFPVLQEVDAFLLQILHALHHVLAGWTRMGVFHEIAYCLQRRANDSSFWQRVERQAQADAPLPQFVAIIAELAARFFHAPLPAIVKTWKMQLPPPVKVWLEKYGPGVAFAKVPIGELDLFPTAKLVLFLHRQFLPDAKRRRHFMRRRLLPWGRPGKIVRSIKKQPALLFDAKWRERQFMFNRVVFHTGSLLRYLCEMPRWVWLNRKKAALGVAP